MLSGLEFIESKIFSKQVRELSAGVLTSIQSDLVQNPERGNIVKGTHGVRKARVADPDSLRGKSGSYVICIYTSNTPVEFTCCTYSARASKPIYHRIKGALSAR
jgi:mRNA-degrading endonuclease RelE of RelBE toxin-antitoxin system